MASEESLRTLVQIRAKLQQNSHQNFFIFPSLANRDIKSTYMERKKDQMGEDEMRDLLTLSYYCSDSDKAEYILYHFIGFSSLPV